MQVKNELLRQILQPFHHDGKPDRGFIFGVTLLPMLIMLGSAMDFASALNTQVRLQGAAETASLSLLEKLAAGEDQAGFRTAAESIIATVGGPAVPSLSALVIDQQKVCIKAGASTSPAFMKIAGVNVLHVKAESCRNRPQVVLGGLMRLR